MLVPKASVKGVHRSRDGFPVLFRSHAVAPARVIPWDGPSPPDVVVDASGQSFCSLCVPKPVAAGRVHGRHGSPSRGMDGTDDDGGSSGTSGDGGLQQLGVGGRHGTDGGRHICGVAGHDARASQLEQVLLDNYPPRKVVRFAPGVEFIPNATS